MFKHVPAALAARILACILIPFAILTWATVRFGAAQARATSLPLVHAKAGTLEASGEKWIEPYWFCQARVVAPLLVRVDYGTMDGGFNSDGGTVYYFWLPGLLRRLYWTSWIS
jgi:hypothetical protein